MNISHRGYVYGDETMYDVQMQKVTSEKRGKKSCVVVSQTGHRNVAVRWHQINIVSFGHTSLKVSVSVFHLNNKV